jgi:hypothetical protein
MLLPVSMLIAYLILRRPIREICEEIGFEKARQRFREQRERLEARFLTALGRIDPEEQEHWEQADWRDEIVWARDRSTRTLNALVAVRFDPPPFTDLPSPYATALFEYHDGNWSTDGQWFDDLRPEEAVALHRQLEPVIVSRHRPSQTGDAML